MKLHFPGSNSCIKFRLLMWKNFLQQWRHRLQTVVEVLLPVATMSLVLILRQQIEPVKREAILYPPVPAYTLKYSAPVLISYDYANLSIAYSPESPVLGAVIQRAAINLFSRNIKEIIEIILDRIQELPELPDIPIEIPPDINLNSTIIEEIIRRLVKIKAYSSSSDLQSIYTDENDIRKVIAAVEFDDKLLGFDDSWTVPSNLSYALRFPEKPRLNSLAGTGGSSWRTDNIFPFFELPGPRFRNSWEGGNDPGYVNEMFIGLQHAISMELVSFITGEDLKNFTVNLNRYPHPPYLQDLAVEALIFIFPLFFMLSFSYTAVNIIRTVTVEKELQLKETMKIMGLPTWLHWMAWFCKQFLYLFSAAALIVILLKVNWFSNEQGYSNYSVFTNTSWSVLLFYVVLYLTCTIFFCFMISSFFSKGSTAALFGGIIWFITYIPAFLLGMDVEVSLAVQTITCLSINSVMSYGFQLILRAESGQGMQWGEFFSNHTLDSNRLLFGHICIMLLVDCVLYMLVALYFEQVLPGPFGTPQVWYFPFQKSFWFPSRQITDDYGLDEDSELDVTIKEKDPTNHQIGVKMANLTKVYGSNTVVNNLSLNIYDDQITVLLGHNGAGKSTTISMLTGNVEVTRGNVWVAGYDMTSQTPLARAHIGLCPQHNVLFNELTVREHLEFFARLKGFRGQQLNEDIDKLIDSLELQEKSNYKAEGLSGGQKRRLCVGIALCGGARVVLLDEPTSGMDPSSRRALWDLLQREKKNRSMILTTHFMDEADFLGDRVAIMSSGKLQCVGSPYFLKQHYGVGYTMVIVKGEDFELDRCTDLIKKYIPNTTVKQDRGKEVTYSLPNSFSHLFEEMLNDLEKNLHVIHYKSYGLVATTLEDVFMSVGSDLEVHSESDDNTTISADTECMDNESDEGSLEQLHKSDLNETGFRLIWLHVSGIWLKLFWVSSRSLGVLLLQVLVPILIINISLAILQYLFANRPIVISRPLTLSEGYLSTETFLGSNGTDESAIGALAYKGYEALYETFNIESMKLRLVENIPLDEYYLEKTDDPVVMAAMRNKLLIGATFGNNEAVAWFSNFGYHDVATSLATVHSAILKGFNSTAILSVFNHPLNANYRDRSDLQLMVTLLSLQVANSIGNSLAIVSAAFIMFYIKERVSRAKLLQRAAGVRPVVMWFAAALYDWIWFMLLCIPVIISCAAFAVIGLSSAAELGRLFLCLMVYGAAMLPLHYLFSLLFNGPAIGFVVMFFVNVLFGLMGAQIVEALMSIETNAKVAAVVLDYILQFFPLYSVVTSTRLINQAGLKTFSCMELCNNLVGGIGMPNITDCTMDTLCQTFPETCCVSDNIFEWKEPGILRYLVCSIGSCVVFWSVLMIIEYSLFGRLLTRLRKAPPVNELASTLDDDVAAEAEHAQRASSDRGLVARGLTKYYGKHLAVDQISFTVNKAEIFGLLGVNGAGKTTTFKMLMGDESVSSGDAFVSGYSVRKDITKVHENIGYCPQFDAVFGELTGRETIHLFSRFRGLKYANSSLRAEIIANAFGFTKHLDKRVEQYSGGNKRKLSTGVSLLGGTRLVFVDEPTTGVDPAAKRTVWRALRAARRAGRAFVLTSHSMEECEALCDRLTVMVNGRFRCLGSPQHLKTKFSEGFTLTIKIRTHEDSADTSDRNDSGTDAVKRYVNANFQNVKLMEEYQGILTYYLPDRSAPWSNMFGIMERAKRELDVEDYSILQTTLEQIFLQFTKYQQDSTTL